MMIPINYEKQPTGNTCGPTCIKMALKYIMNKPNDLPFDFEITTTIDEIAKLCGTDWVVGTPPEKMIKGFDALKISYIEYIHSPRPFDLLKEVITSGNIPIVRTITHGVPHWIIVNGFTEEHFLILDPWQGIIKYTPKQLNDIWMVRDYQFFEIVTDGD